MASSAQTVVPVARTIQGFGVFTNTRVYQGPIIGYVDSSIDSPFTYLYTYYSFYGSDTVYPGQVRIDAPGLFPGAVSFSGSVGIDTSRPGNRTFSLQDQQVIEAVTLSIDYSGDFPASPGPASVLPTSTINFGGRFFGYAGTITSLTTGPNVAAVPEVATWVMLMLGLGLAGGSLRRLPAGRASIRSASTRLAGRRP